MKLCYLENILPLKRSRLFTDENGEIVRVMTEKSPAHCILKINSFSMFQAVNGTEFSVGGYTWVLSVSLSKGNKKEKGDHLSVYVTLVDKLAPGSFVDVVLRFFVYDHLRDAYLSVLDVREKRYHALRDKWGVPKFLPISTFKKKDYGFLVDDCCVFGAEVLVINNQQVKISTMSIVGENCDKYTWRIESFQSLSDRLCSPEICFNGWSWKLDLRPKGDSSVKGEYVSLFLHLENSSKLTHGNKLFVKYILRVKNQRQGQDCQELVHQWFSASAKSWGFKSFISLKVLNDPWKGYLVNNTIVIQLHIQKMILLRDVESDVN
ncbi:uncharacterized protein LOC110723163 [Chenopodium quinoa]|uniref:uncharacterized protein LOC110723163 n=1 Tax=Chenopodium quinoa TaxID=63459 RepID=UPI000B79A44B|nr:uncharacterized protein LOC110723163 [Chenopodium quinoa]